MTKAIVIVVLILIAALFTSGLVLLLFYFGTFIPFIPIPDGGGEIQYEETLVYYYNPSEISEVEEFKIDLSVGEIDFEYTDDPEAALIEAVFNFKFYQTGIDSYTDVYNPIIWENSSSPVNLLLDIRDDVSSITQTVHLFVTLRSDGVFALNADTSAGAIRMIASEVELGDLLFDTSAGEVSFEGTEITNRGGLKLYTSAGAVSATLIESTIDGQVDLDTSAGAVELDATSCEFGSDIILDTSAGEIILDLINPSYADDVLIDVHTSAGAIEAKISQNVEMGGSVTGSFTTSAGSVELMYDDSLSSVGAIIEATSSLGGVDFVVSGFSESGDTISSLDFPAANNYDLTCHSSVGGVDVTAESA